MPNRFVRNDKYTAGKSAKILTLDLAPPVWRGYPVYSRNVGDTLEIPKCITGGLSPMAGQLALEIRVSENSFKRIDRRDFS